MYCTLRYSTLLYSTLLYSTLLCASLILYVLYITLYVCTYCSVLPKVQQFSGRRGGEGRGGGGLGWDCAFWIVLPTFENSETPECTIFLSHKAHLPPHVAPFFFRTLAMLYIVPAYLQYVQYLLSEVHKSEQKIPSLLYSEGYREGGVGNLYTENSPSNRFTTYLQYLPTYLLIAGFFTMAGFTNSEV